MADYTVTHEENVIGLPVLNVVGQGLLLAGVVLDSSGDPSERTVRLYSDDTGELLSETQSDAGDGSFSFSVDDPGDYYVVGISPSEEERYLIARVRVT